MRKMLPFYDVIILTRINFNAGMDVGASIDEYTFKISRYDIQSEFHLNMLYIRIRCHVKQNKPGYRRSAMEFLNIMRDM